MLWTSLQRQALKRTLALPERLYSLVGDRVGDKRHVLLDPKVRLLLKAAELRPQLNQGSVEEARNAYSEICQLTDLAVPKTVTTRDHFMPVNGDEVFLRSYHPEKSRSTSAMPGLLFIHGGGFTVGSVEDYQGIAAWIAEQTGSTVVSLDYRLGPEHVYPTAAEDAIAGWQWLNANADKLGLNPARLGIMGDSAGGNLAAVVSQQAQRRGLPLPKLQCLVYPTTDLRMVSDSISRYGEGFGLTRELIKWFRQHYLQDPNQADELLASPGLTKDLQGQPKTLLITATDPLRDEGVGYVAKLQDSGVDVVHLDYPQLIHGFITFCGVLPSARTAMAEVCQLLAEQL